jgi:hypothetical protein
MSGLGAEVPAAATFARPDLCQLASRSNSITARRLGARQLPLQSEKAALFSGSNKNPIR